MIDSNTRMLAVVGYPCRHSLSPAIHNYFIKKAQYNAAYVAFEFSPDHFDCVFDGMVAMNFIGFNVTMPYKQEAYRKVDSLSEAAAATESVNTVKILPGFKTKGFNTDINGLINCLKNKDFKWKSSQALVLGAGGAARSSIYGLLTKNIKKIYIYNRSLDRAKNIRKLFNNDDRIEIIKYLNNVNAKEINLIINCTPIGMTIDDNLGNKMPIPENWDLYGKFVVEMVYKPVETLLAVKAKKQKAVLINGWDILLSQAAFSFKIWFSQDNIPDTEEINKKLKKLIQNGGLHGFK